jgi:hypothetical protein
VLAFWWSRALANFSLTSTRASSEIADKAANAFDEASLMNDGLGLMNTLLGGGDDAEESAYFDNQGYRSFTQPRSPCAPPTRND